ncbi:hypothetical protein MKX01_035823, partial [Papaver californicum]
MCSLGFEGLKGSHDDYRELLVFSEKGDWETAKIMFKHDPKAISALELLKLMPLEVLELQETKYGYTELHTVVVEGNVEVAKAMVEKHSKLTQIREHNGSVPLKVAAEYITDRQEEMVNYLWSVTRNVEPITALDMIAGRPFAFLSGCKLTLWERWIYSVIAVDLLPAPAPKHMKGDVENHL